ncbi:MAG: rhomboid family intramembrane serine protease [Saprospiraceae bacterium]|nr:rhomboid family intramembrane serine protease [Saprospiraceae bacterium]
MNEFIHKEKEHLRNALSIALSVSVLCLLVHLLFLVSPIPKYNWSIYPRDFSQWYGIITGQFIHASWGHLFSNLPPLFITTGVLFYFYRSIGWASYFLILTITGLMVFILGRNYSHIGASGLVYGLISFIFFSGIFRRNVKSIALMGIMVVMYSGYLAGFFPTEERGSWESQLFGAVVGLWTSFVFSNYREFDEHQVPEWKNEKAEAKEFFLPRDTFDKTKEERKRDLDIAQNFSNTDHTGFPQF